MANQLTQASQTRSNPGLVPGALTPQSPIIAKYQQASDEFTKAFLAQHSPRKSSFLNLSQSIETVKNNRISKALLDKKLYTLRARSADTAEKSGEKAERLEREGVQGQYRGEDEPTDILYAFGVGMMQGMAHELKLAFFKHRATFDPEAKKALDKADKQVRQANDITIISGKKLMPELTKTFDASHIKSLPYTYQKLTTDTNIQRVDLTIDQTRANNVLGQPQSFSPTKFTQSSPKIPVTYPTEQKAKKSTKAPEEPFKGYKIRTKLSAHIDLNRASTKIDTLALSHNALTMGTADIYPAVSAPIPVKFEQSATSIQQPYKAKANATINTNSLPSHDPSLTTAKKPVAWEDTTDYGRRPNGSTAEKPVGWLPDTNPAMAAVTTEAKAKVKWEDTTDYGRRPNGSTADKPVGWLPNTDPAMAATRNNPALKSEPYPTKYMGYLKPPAVNVKTSTALNAPVAQHRASTQAAIASTTKGISR